MQFGGNNFGSLRAMAFAIAMAMLALPGNAYGSWGSWWSWLTGQSPAVQGKPPSGIYADGYPVAPSFRADLEQLRSQGKLKADDEEWIDRMVATASGELQMPPSILWCLLFQESRLDHLKGITENRGALGLGQFSDFSFYEINHQLDRFAPNNVNMMMSVMGTDIRPVTPDDKNPDSPSSYFYIPTAVVTSAAYLNSRYQQLRKILDRQGISYDSDLLWLYASMAYNKGTRSVVAIWQDTLRHGGKSRLEEQLSHVDASMALWQHDAIFFRGLSRIWPSDAERYAHELGIHLRNMMACSLREPYDTEGS